MCVCVPRELGAAVSLSLVPVCDRAQLVVLALPLLHSGIFSIAFPPPLSLVAPDPNHGQALNQRPLVNQNVPEYPTCAMSSFPRSVDVRRSCDPAA